MGNLAGWPYWKVISLTGQSGAGADYQVELKIGDSAGGDFHLEGHCTNFPQDIRITDDDGTTLLDHFVEDLTADPIVVRVKVNDDLGSNRDIRVYYGKSGESTASNIDNTFIFGDDFPGSSLNGTKWGSQDVTVGVSGGILTLSSFTSGAGRYAGGILGKTLISSPVIIEWEANCVYDGDCAWLGLGEDHNFLTNDGTLLGFYTVERLYRSSRNDGTVTEDNTGTFTENVYHRMRVDWISGTETHFWYDGGEVGTKHTTNIPNEQMYAVVSGDSNLSATLKIDYMFVRKYNSPEPAFSSAGAEQSPVTGHPWYYRRNQ